MITPGIAVVLVVVTAAAATSVCTAFHIPPRASGGSGRSNNLQQTKQYRHSNCLPCQRQALITRCSSGKAVDTEPDSKTEEVQMQGDGDQVEAEATSEGDKADQEEKPVYTPEEEAYLKRLADAPTLYKRNPDVPTYPSIGYDGAFESPEDKEKYNYRANPYVTGEDGQEKMLLRVVIVGGGDKEGTFVQALSKQGTGTLVSGLYVLWNPADGELSRKFEKVPYVNVHELGPKNTRDPVKVAKHASFLCAHMIVVVAQGAEGSDFAARVKAEALTQGVTFVGPDVAGQVSEGNMETFTKLVEGTREVNAEE